MGRHNHVAIRAEIMRVLGSTGSTVAEAAARVGIPRELAAHHLKVLHREGRIERCRMIVPHFDSPGARTMFTYQVKDVPVQEGQVAGAPYRNLRLTEDLVGYGSSLFAFAGLCMAVRK